MTPAEHYAEAERLIGWTANAPAGSDRALIVAEAQVHATLATAPQPVAVRFTVTDPSVTDRPVEPHARQRAAVNWPPCEACDHPASRHDLTSDHPPKGGWNDLIEPCQVDDCGCLGYLGEVGH